MSTRCDISMLFLLKTFTWIAFTSSLILAAPVAPLCAVKFTSERILTSSSCDTSAKNFQRHALKIEKTPNNIQNVRNTWAHLTWISCCDVHCSNISKKCRMSPCLRWSANTWSVCHNYLSIQYLTYTANKKNRYTKHLYL